MFPIKQIMNLEKIGETFTINQEENMEKVKQVWTLAKANPKISAAVVVVIVAIYFLVNQELYDQWPI